MRMELVGAVGVSGFAGQIIEIPKNDHHGGTGYKPGKKH